MKVKFGLAKVANRRSAIALSVTCVVIGGIILASNLVARRQRVAVALVHVRTVTNLQSDLGVNVQPKVTGIVYSKSDNVVYLSSKALITNSNGECSADGAPLGAYIKVMKSDILPDGPLTPWWETQDGLTQATKPDENGVIEAKEFSDFYLVYMHPQAACSSSQSVQQEQANEAQAAAAAIASAQAAQ